MGIAGFRLSVAMWHARIFPRGGKKHPIKAFFSADLSSMAYLVVNFSSHHDPNSSVSTGVSGVSNGLYEAQDLVTLPFASVASLEFSLGKTMFFTISSETGARLNFSESLS